MFRFLSSSVVFSFLLARSIVSALKKTISSKVISTISIIEEKITYQKIEEYANRNKHNIKQLYGVRINYFGQNHLSHSELYLRSIL